MSGGGEEIPGAAKLERFLGLVNKYDIQFDLPRFIGSGDWLEPHLPRLLDALPRTHRHMKMAILGMIEAIGGPALPALPALVELCGSSDSMISFAAESAIVSLIGASRERPDALASALSTLEAAVASAEADQARWDGLAGEFDRALEGASARYASRDPVLKPVTRSSAPYLRSRLTSEADGVSERAFALLDELVSIQRQGERLKHLRVASEVVQRRLENGWQDQGALFAEIRAWAGARKEWFEEAYLYGSRRGDGHRRDSDVDVAVRLRERNWERARELWLERQPAWHAALQERLPYPLDLQLLFDEERTPEVHRGVQKGYARML